MSGLFSHANLTITSYLLRAYFWSILFPIALIPIDFYYRFRWVCSWVCQTFGNSIYVFSSTHQGVINTRCCSKDPLSNNQLLGLVFLAYFVTFVEAFFHGNMFILLGPSEETRKYTQILRKYSTKWKGSDVPSFSVYESVRDLPLHLNFLMQTNILAILSILLIILLILFVYIVVIYTVWHINAKVREDCKSIKNKRLRPVHSQVARILFVQVCTDSILILIPALKAAIPLVLCIPSSVICMGGLLHLDMPDFGVYALSISVWLAVLKPLATIAVVPNYRKSLFCAKRTNLLSTTVFQLSNVNKLWLLTFIPQQ